MANYSLSPDKVYLMPQDIRFVDYNNKIIVVAPDYANWIVLDSKIQQNIFNTIRDGESIGKTVKLYENHSKDVRNVLTQIEARKFCTKKIYSSVDEKRSMHLYLTNRCNLQCPHCYMYSGATEQNELSTDDIIKLITEYRYIVGGETITISGGEPTIRPDFKIIVKAAKDLGLQVSILTNGTLFRENDIPQLSKYIDSIQISLDGYSEDSNSRVRGEDNFEKALNSVDLFVKNGVRTSISITPPLEEVKYHWMDYVKFSKSLIEHYQNFDFEIRFADELLKGRHINPSDQEKREYFNIINQILKEIYGSDYDIMYFVRDLYYGAIMDNCMFGIFAVKSNGDVYLCARIGDLKPIANIKNTSLSQINAISYSAEKSSRIMNLTPCNRYCFKKCV